MPTDKPSLCPYPGHDTVVCPDCRHKIAGVNPAGTSDEPRALCPACCTVTDTVIIRNRDAMTRIPDRARIIPTRRR